MDWDVFKEMHKEGQATAETRRCDAESQFELAKVLAFNHGLFLRRNTEAHYTLAAGPAGHWIWLWDIYPGKCRIKKSPRHPATPRLDLPPEWNLLHVVEAARALFAVAPKGVSKP
jgi:hypothetical protein